MSGVKAPRSMTMPEQQQEELQRLSPDKLIAGFSKSSILLGLVVAIALHVVVVGATSVDTIHELIDPEWAEQRRLRAESEAQRQADRLRPRVRATTTRAASQPATRKADRKIPKEYREMPKKGQIPKQPDSDLPIDDMGI